MFMDPRGFFFVEVALSKRIWVKFCFDHLDLVFVIFRHPFLDVSSYVSFFVFISNHMMVHTILVQLTLKWFCYLRTIDNTS